MKRSMIRAGAMMAVTALAAVGAALPASAGSNGRGDTTGDQLDPILTQNQAARFYKSSPSTDLADWSMNSLTLANGHPALHAHWHVRGSLPSDGDTNVTHFNSPYPGYIGAQFYMLYSDANKEINSYGLTPQCTNLATNKPVFDFQRHYLDGNRHYLALDLTFDGTKYNATPELGDYVPEVFSLTGNVNEAAYQYHDIQGNPLMAPDVSYSITPDGVGGTNVDVTVPSHYTVKSLTAKEGQCTRDYGSGGDSIVNVTAQSWLSQSVVLPVTVPLSKVPALGENDIQSLGGLIAPNDVSDGLAVNGDYDLGLAGPDNVGDGPTCPTATFGGLLPRNPLFTDGAPCEVNNPIGPHYVPNGMNFVF